MQNLLYLPETPTRSIRPCEVVGTFTHLADKLEQHAPYAAAQTLVHALGQLPPQHPNRPGLVIRAVRLLAATSHHDDLAELVEAESGVEYSSYEQAEIDVSCVEAQLGCGRPEATIAGAGRILLRADLDLGHRARVLAVQAHALAASGNSDDAEHLATLAVRTARSSHCGAAEVSGLLALSEVHGARIELAPALLRAQEAVRRAETSPTSRRINAERWLVRALLAADQHDDAELVMDQALAADAARGAASTWHCRHVDRARLLLTSGRTRAALAETTAGLRAVEASPNDAISDELHRLQAVAHVILGQLGAAAGALDRATRPMPAESFAELPSDHDLDVAWTHLALSYAHGVPRRALERIQDVLDQCRDRALARVVGDPILTAILLRALLATGENDVVRDVVQMLESVAERNPGINSREALAQHARGLFDRDADALWSARESYLLAGLADQATWCGIDAVIAEAASDGDASSTRHKALQLRYECTGRDVVIGQRLLEDVLRQLPEAQPEIAAAPTCPPLEFATLTPAERRVLDVVVAGRTNREIAAQLMLSRHTVDSHLRRIFAKVGVTNRVQLCSAFMADAQAVASVPEPTWGFGAQAV